MKNVYIISPNFLREMTNVSTNLHDKYILSAIREAQDIQYREVVGDKLLNKLLKLIEDKQVDEEGNELFKEIINMSRYYLAYLAVSRIVVISSLKIDNIGLNRTYDENIQAPQINDVFHMEKHYLHIADTYCKRLQNFIKSHRTELREYLTHTCYETDCNLKSSATTGIFLGGYRGKVIRRV